MLPPLRYHMGKPPLATTTERKFLTPAQRIRLACSQDYKCNICKKLLPSVWNADHIVPLHLGGSNDITNMQMLCALCHSNKSQLEGIHRGRNALPASPPASPRGKGSGGCFPCCS